MNTPLPVDTRTCQQRQDAELAALWSVVIGLAARIDDLEAQQAHTVRVPILGELRSDQRIPQPAQPEAA